MKDGRQSRKTKDQKLGQQLNEINKLLKQKNEESGKGGVAGGMHLFDDGGGGKRRKL